jgi:1-acyl-sn-glycerol-3-phosphate acyltransferase
LGKLLGASALFFGLLPIVLRTKGDKWRRFLFRFYCKAFLSSWGARIERHGIKPILDKPHIFVANHSSFIDYLILSADSFPHATVAQRHNGLFGLFQKHILALNGSLVFERSQKNDRLALAQKMKEHVNQPSKSPLLIFPEGTCVNNEYTVLFQKGAFELGAMVVPIAIKYDKSWADAYWHTKTQTFTVHLLYLMTRWKLVADVWYLPPRCKRPGQTAAEFANEVKAEISTIASLKNLSWDGYWKVKDHI